MAGVLIISECFDANMQTICKSSLRLARSLYLAENVAPHSDKHAAKPEVFLRKRLQHNLIDSKEYNMDINLHLYTVENRNELNSLQIKEFIAGMKLNYNISYRQT